MATIKVDDIELEVECGSCSGTLDAKADKHGTLVVDLCRDCVADAVGAAAVE